MWNEFLAALALVLVLEGIFPFIAPEKYKQVMAQLTQMPARALRTIGLLSMLLGIGFLYLLRLFI